MCYIFAYNGTEGTHRYLFARQKYGWDELQYTAYLSLYRVCYLLTLWIVLPVLSRLLYLHDASIAIISCIMGAVGALLPAFLTPGWGFYLGSVIGALSPACTITARYR
jgi:hypothetical protein